MTFAVCQVFANGPFTPKKKPKKEGVWKHQTSNSRLRHSIYNSIPFFVPLWISFVFLCFRGVQLEAHRTFFTTKMSQNLYCVPLVAHHEWESFVPLKLFLYQLVQKKFPLVRNPLESFESSEKLVDSKTIGRRFENNRARGHARGACRGGRQHASGDVRCARPRDKATVISNPASPRPAGAFRVATCQQGVPFASRPVNRARGLSQCTSPLARWRPH